MILARNSITLHHLRDITTVVWYYKLQASTASPPAKPTTATPSGWSTTEPSYTEGSTNSLYVVQKTTFSDGTFEYSDVSLSTSYEAAKAAYNKSVQAQTTANAAQESIDNLEIGGRNLFGLGSDCSATLDGMKNVGFELVTEDGFQCAHATGALTTTRYLQSKIPYTAKPLEKVVFSADVKIKDIALGTTNPMCEFYFSGQTINGSWKGTKSAQTYIDGQLVGVGNKKFNTFLPNNEWHHVTVKVEYADAEFTVLMNPSIYFRDATGEIWIKNIKFERGNQETDWSPAPEDGKPPIATKKYTDIIGTANDTANATFYFAKIHPTNYTVQWNVSLRFRVVAPEAYAQDVTISLGGYGSSFSSYNAYTVRTGSIGMYYVSLFRATSAGISTNHKGHALGFSLKNATQPTNTSYKRTIIVDVIETQNCTVEMLDTAVKYASIDGTGSTNYSGTAPTEMSVATAGQNATNNTNTSRTQFASAVKAGAFGCKRYTLLMKDTDDTWVSFVNQSNNTGTSKTVSAGGHILGKLIYLDAGSDYASGSNTGAVFDAREFDFRYSSNCGSTLVAYRPVYLVGTIHSDGLFYFDADTSKWYTQEVPTTEDGRTYIYVGMAYSTTSVWLSTENEAYQYYTGKFRTLREIEEMEAAKKANNYLSMDNTGIMVADMSGGTQYTPSTVPSGVKNAFIDNDSFDVRDGQDVLASFGETSRIGKYYSSHLDIDATGLQGVNEDGFTVFDVQMDGTEKGYYHLLVFQKIDDEFPHIEIRSTTPPTSLVVGRAMAEEVKKYSPVTLNISFKLLDSSTSQIETQSFANIRGFEYGVESTREFNTTAAKLTITYDGNYQFYVTGVLPQSYVDRGLYAVIYCENYTYRTTIYSPAFSFGTRQDDTLGDFSAIIGEKLNASHNNQVACGKYNEESSDYAFMVGNGSDSGNSNAYAVTWDGNQLMALDNTASSGTTDADLYDAITALGWEDDVLV